MLRLIKQVLCEILAVFFLLASGFSFLYFYIDGHGIEYESVGSVLLINIAITLINALPFIASSAGAAVMASMIQYEKKYRDLLFNLIITEFAILFILSFLGIGLGIQNYGSINFVFFGMLSDGIHILLCAIVLFVSIRKKIKALRPAKQQ